MLRSINRAFQFLTISVLLAFLNSSPGNAQGKVINQYARIISVQSSDTTDVDSVEVSGLNIFEAGDTVLFIMMKGVEVYTPSNAPYDFWGETQNINNTGIYNILLVNKVSGNYVIFTTTLRKLNPMKPGEVGQLVKFSGGRVIYEVNEPLTCKQWDPVEGTGGVLALIAGRKIVLNNTIDISGKGFLGGDPDYPTKDHYQGICSAAVDSFYTENGVDSSGRKGESIVVDGFPLTRGMMYVANGGGGGNGKFSGGGGGSNYGKGEQGGWESESCSPGDPNLAGVGYYISGLYTTSYLPNRIFMGGGGGTSTQDTVNSRFATKGGNGGGIIILVTDTIQATGNGYVRARGGNVTDTASAGAGGGGGGGVIILEAVGYKGNINFSVEGGNGGWTNHIDPTGPGGFGGGGVIWHSGPSLPANITVKVDNGKCGNHLTAGARGAVGSSSLKGTVIPKLMIPLSGFLFNVMPDDQDICEGKTPIPFYASTPKGGTGKYTYRWIKSPDKETWNNAPGKNDSIYYVPGAHIDTTYYKRIVYSGATTDTSLILSINVLPVLQNNNIAADDTICAGSLAPDIKDDPFFNITGGNGTYTFSWESHTNITAWASTGVTDTILRQATPLETTYYRRVVTSHVCSDASDSVTITVLEAIQDNLISPDDSICENENGQIIYGQPVSGGDGTYNYNWQASLNNSTWIPAKIPNNGLDYEPDTLVTTRYYRRIVISGSEEVCKDTSNVITRLVHPLIINNLISRDTIICMDDPGLTLTQLSGTVEGGNGINYYYNWQSRIQGENWDTAYGIDTLSGYECGYLADTSGFRRLVISGACRDTSNVVEIIVQDSIMNNLITDNDTICRESIPDPLTGLDVPTGGDGIYSYQWELRENFTDWSAIPAAIQSGYSPPSLTDTTYYRRKVLSGKCFHTSEFVTVIVQAPISNNVIKNGSTDETCYETSLILDGTDGITEVKGGDEVMYIYLWDKSDDNMNWTPAPGINNLEEYTTEDLMLPAYFRRNVESGACTNISAATYVSINPRPTGEFLNAEYPALCYDTGIGAVEIEIQYKLTGTPPYNLIYWNGYDDDTLENIASDEGSFMSYFTTTDTTLYEIELTNLTDANSCIAYHDSLTGVVNAVLYKRPGAVILEDEDTIQVCDDLMELQSQTDVGFGYWIKVSGDENLFMDDSSGTTVQVSTIFDSRNSQHYKLYRTNLNWPVNGGEYCFSRDSIEVIFWNEPDPANAGSRPEEEYDTLIFFADYINLYADPPTAGRGKWTLVSGTAVIENDTLPDTYVNLGDKNLDEPAEYIFNWTITNGICTPTSDMLRISRRDLRAYGGFSPDGNGINDFFTVGGLGYADTYDMKIFSRSGNLIRRIIKGTGDEGLPGDELWDGTYDGGRPVENGVYYYTLEVIKGNHPRYQYSGYIVITREKQ